MKVNSLKTLAYIVGKSWLADSLQVQIVWNSTCLMEFSEKIVKVNDGSSVVDEGIPVATNLAGMLNEKGIPTKQGKQWQPMQISRLVKVAA